MDETRETQNQLLCPQVLVGVGLPGEVKTLGKQLEGPWYQIKSMNDGGKEVEEKNERKRETIYSPKGATSNCKVASPPGKWDAGTGWRVGGRLPRGTI